MSAHTPGPWFAVDRGRKGEPMMSVMAERISGRGPSHEVAMCATGDSPQEMEDANARLIAASPELYEALALLVELLDAGQPPGSDDMHLARAALAKAVQP